LSGDVRDLEMAVAEGHKRARLALDVFVSGIRQYLGACLVELGGVDVLVFTGGIGENSRLVRSGVCQGLEEFGIALDAGKNDTAKGECRIDQGGRAQIWIVPTNEELIVARQARELIEKG
jgi:acetate kinase